jgi:hypothetical protein
MSIPDVTARIIIDDELKNIVPEDEVERFVDRFRGQEECERAEIRKIHRKPRDYERCATCYAVLEMKSVSGVSYKSLSRIRKRQLPRRRSGFSSPSLSLFGQC